MRSMTVDPVVPLAEGVLAPLYGLGSLRRARQLLRAAADRHEVAVRMPAQPIVDTWGQPGPDATVPARPRPPDLPLTGAPATDPGLPGRILARGLELCGNQYGDVQLVNTGTGRLVLAALRVCLRRSVRTSPRSTPMALPAPMRGISRAGCASPTWRPVSCSPLPPGT
ncbi:hypothetical protein ACH4A8_17435 [Streptomyces vietnamensis]|uniref:hypothetical protein n=1 Tax=Streptomyces vietnamensis TaxID=362257 RepID=UPI0037AE409B